MTTMRALVLNADGSVTYRVDQPVPVPGRQEALVRVKRAGICQTDLEVIKGYNNFTGVLGYEFVGVVEQIEDDAQLGVGERVVGEITVSRCHLSQCAMCEKGGVARRNHCARRSVLGILEHDGAFADYLSLPVVNLHAVPEAVTEARAAFTEPVAAALRVLEQGLITAGHRVAVIGDGRLGLLLAEVVALQPIRELVVIGKHPNKLARLVARDHVTHHVVNDDTGSKFNDYFDVVVEATGSPTGLTMAINITQPLGTIVLKTTCASDTYGVNTAALVVKELRIVGSRCGNFRMALEVLERGELLPERLVDHTYPIAEALTALHSAANKDVLKVQLTF